MFSLFAILLVAFLCHVASADPVFEPIAPSSPPPTEFLVRAFPFIASFVVCLFGIFVTLLLRHLLDNEEDHMWETKAMHKSIRSLIDISQQQLDLMKEDSDEEKEEEDQVLPVLKGESSSNVGGKRLPFSHGLPSDDDDDDEESALPPPPPPVVVMVEDGEDEQGVSGKADVRRRVFASKHIPSVDVIKKLERKSNSIVFKDTEGRVYVKAWLDGTSAAQSAVSILDSNPHPDNSFVYWVYQTDPSSSSSLHPEIGHTIELQRIKGSPLLPGKQWVTVFANGAAESKPGSRERKSTYAVLAPSTHA